MIKTVIVKADNGYFFSLLPCPIKELCNCYTLSFNVAIGCGEIVTLVEEGQLTLSSVINRVKNSLIEALQNDLELNRDLSFAHIRAKAYRASEQLILAIETGQSDLAEANDDWMYKYEFVKTSYETSSWIGTRGKNIYIEIFGGGIPKEDDTPLAVIQIDFETGREWLRIAFALLEAMNDVDGFTNARLYKEQELVKHLL